MKANNKKLFLFFFMFLFLTSCATMRELYGTGIPSFRDTVSSDYKKIEKTNINLQTAFAECEALGEMARGEMVTDVLSEVDDYWKNRNIVVDKCMNSKGFELK